VSEWLDLMLEEIARKKREADEAQAENLRRKEQEADEAATEAAQSK
jgi:hypothetical protein